MSVKKIELRPYQKEAIERWKENNYTGILSMATGTGKTIIAIEAIRSFLNEGKIGLIIVPTKALLKQWYGVIKNHFPKSIVVCCYSENVDWKRRVKSLIRLYLRQKGTDIMSNHRQKVIISTMGTAWKNDFKKLIEPISHDDIVVIIDEVHRVGAFRYRNILTLPFKKRIGLSATPIREWDYIGTKKIKEYFGGIIYNYTLSDAIQDGYLAPYKYYVEPVALTIEEVKEYLEISEEIRKIVKFFLQEYPGYSIKDIISMVEELEVEEESIASLQYLLISRRRIIKKCKNKYNAILKIIRENKDKLRSCLIYCEDYKQLDKLKNLLLEEGISVGEYTARLDADEREIAFSAVKEGHIQFLLSCKCLDEGVDIPTCDAAILMANSTMEREFIQRRGRLLRLHPSKKHATIFDLVVVPYKKIEDQVPLNEVELNILDRELERVRFFANDAINKEEVTKKINIIYEIFM